MWKIIFLNVKMCPRSLAKTWTLHNWKISDSFWEKIILCSKRGVLPRVTLHVSQNVGLPNTRLPNLFTNPLTEGSHKNVPWISIIFSKITLVLLFFQYFSKKLYQHFFFVLLYILYSVLFPYPVQLNPLTPYRI